MSEGVKPLGAAGWEDGSARLASELPEDRALPALVAIRAVGLAEALPGLRLADRAVQFRLRSHHTGSRVTIEARTAHDHLAIKSFARDPVELGELHQAFCVAGVVSGPGVRVPPLVAWDRELNVLVFGWLEGPSAHWLLTHGQGARAGDLGARWIRPAAPMSVKLGLPRGAPHMLHRAEEWVAALGSTAPELGVAATALFEILALHQPDEGPPRLVHGTFYSRHVIDLGGDSGVIDWDGFGQGPVELDAGMFLATVARHRLLHEPSGAETGRAEAAFRKGISGPFEEVALRWHQAAALFCLADHLLTSRRAGWLQKASTLLGEAARLARSATRSSHVTVRARGAHAVPPPGHAESVGAGHRVNERAVRPGQSICGAASTLTRLDLALMDVLWARGEATVHELSQDLDRPSARSTIAAQLSRLEREGMVTHRVTRRHYVYRAAVDQAALQRSVVEDFASLADGLFEGDVAALVCQLVKARDAKPEDLARAIALLKERGRELEVKKDEMETRR